MEVELSLILLHRRQGNSAEGALEEMIRGEMMRCIEGGVKRVSIGVCEPSKLGKITQHPHMTVPPENHGQKPLELVVMDLAGPNRSQTLGGKLYDMVLVDTFSRRSWVELLGKKSEAAGVLERWIPLVENQCDMKLKKIRSDNGGEFIPNWFRDC